MTFLQANLLWAENLIRARLADTEEAQRRLGEERLRVLAELEALSVGPQPFFALCRHLRLSALESQIVALCLAQMIEPRLGRLLAELPESCGPRITPAILGRLLCGDEGEARLQLLTLLSHESRLRASRVLDVPSLCRDGLLDTPLYLTRACLALLTGQALLSPLCRSFGEVLAPQRQVLSEARLGQLRDLLLRFGAVLERGPEPGGIGWILLLFCGPAGVGKRTLARALGAEFFTGTVEIDAEAIQSSSAPLDVLRDALDAALLRGALLHIENGHALGQGQGGAEVMLLAQLRVTPLCVILSSAERQVGPRLERALSQITHFPLPPQAGTEQAWQAQLPAGVVLGPDVNLAALAQRYPLPAEAIGRAVRMALAYASAEEAAHVNTAHLERAAAAQVDNGSAPPKSAPAPWLDG